MQAVLIVLVVVLAVAALMLWARLNAVKSLQAPAGHGAGDLEKKVEALKAELASTKDEVGRKQKQLEEAREEAKKKLRREGKKQQEREEEKASGPDPRDIEIQGLKKGMSALESQLNIAKRDLERATGDVERTRGDARSETEGAQKARDDERNRNRSLSEENAALKRTLEELRSAKKKESDRPDVPGSGLDLKSLPTDAVQELARYFRKGEEFERLYHVTSGQMQLEKDRYQELQRRYFAVCRELALVAGQKPQSDADAKIAAEAMVAGSDKVARASTSSARPRPEAAAAAGAGDAAEGTAADAAAPADGQKKRRRRRRRRKPGAQGELPGTGGAAAADGAADADDGADGDDDGDEGPDEGADEAPAAPAADSGRDTGPTPAPAA